jgi:hypothetical protein
MPIIGFARQIIRMRGNFNHVLSLILQHMVVNTWLTLEARAGTIASCQRTQQQSSTLSSRAAA